MMASRACQNAVRFSVIEDIKMNGLMFNQSALQKKLGFRPDQVDYLFAFSGGEVFAEMFTTFVLFEQCLKRFKERNDSEPLKVFVLFMSDEDKEDLEGDFVLEVIESAMWSLPKGRAPGSDGIPVEFYAMFVT
ncbi:hypothetical protein NDU88_011338 [Pleurodeles waltl]|uniref:Zinc finger CCHC domain-containing protein n=1 Tax=Pleurodeles waltl TaxID=8319 RepID=A0AAV7R137_PLEWA|nr:hypothetical protein NDU88_011338 [Pleurodeles waltl]